MPVPRNSLTNNQGVLEPPVLNEQTDVETQVAGVPQSSVFPYLTPRQLDLFRRSREDVPLTAEEEDELSAVDAEQLAKAEETLSQQRPRKASFETPAVGARLSGNVTGADAGPLERMAATALQGPMSVLRGTGIEGGMYGFTEMLLALPDAAINTGIKLAERAGAIEPNSLNRDILERLFLAGDYEEAERIAPFIFYGRGQEAGGDAGFMDRYARKAGEFAGTGYIAGNILKKYSNLYAPPGQFVDDLGVNVTRITESGGALTPRVTETILAPYRSNPNSALALDTGFGAVSGVGAQVEEDIFGTQTGIGTIAPFALWYAATRGPIARGFNWIKDKVSA